jgi:hypothetical protein
MYLAVLMFAGALWWCLYIFHRLPSDVAELARLFGEWRRSRNVLPCGDLRSEERRKSDTARSARDFWSTVVVQCCFFWPVTVILLVWLVIPGLTFTVRSLGGAMSI